MGRANFLGVPQFLNLNHAVKMVNEAFGGGGAGTYLVGSCLKKRDYRDVDVRTIMPDEEYDRLFPNLSGNPTVEPAWSLICAAISEWIAARTGLPIDYQIQKQSEATKEFSTKDGHERQALGLFYRKGKEEIIL